MTKPFLLIMCILLAGCTSALELITITEEAPKLVFVRPAPIAPLIPMEPTVLTPDTTKMLNEKGEPYGYYGYTLNQQIAKRAWLEDVLRYVRQQNALLDNLEKPKEIKND